MFNNAPNGGDPGAMPCDAGQPAPCGPAAVAVHEDGHMQFFVNVTLHSTVTSHNVALRVPSPAASLLLLAKSPAKYAATLLYRGPDFLCRIPVLRCVLWDLRHRLLRGNARRWEGAVPVDPASEVHGSRNRQETSNRAYEQCIILESQQ
jgi:hypothetical protein